jgi:hypothetical protein
MENGRMSILKITVLTGAVCLTALLGYKYVTADPPGYCSAQQRYISDEEFIKASVILLEGAMKRKSLKWDSNPDSLNPGLKRVFERLEKNRNRPGFTQVVRDDTHTISRWLFGYQQVQVVLNANSGDEHLRYFYNVCGRVLESGFADAGFTTTEIINSK